MSDTAKSSPGNPRGGQHEAHYAATSAGYAGGCTCFYLRSATRRITQVYDEGLKAARVARAGGRVVGFVLPAPRVPRA